MFGSKETTPGADERVRAILEELEINFTIDDDFDFRVGFQMSDDRTQSCIIRSRTYKFLDIEIREISSGALLSEGPFDARTANILLQENERLSIGAWGVVRSSDDRHIAVFTAKIAADLPAHEFQGVLQAVLATADDMENRLSGRDDF